MKNKRKNIVYLSRIINVKKTRADYLLQKWKPVLDAFANPALSKAITNMPEAQESILGNSNTKSR